MEKPPFRCTAMSFLRKAGKALLPFCQHHLPANSAQEVEGHLMHWCISLVLITYVWQFLFCCCQFRSVQSPPPPRNNASARPGLAWPGQAWPGLAGCSQAMPGLAWICSAWLRPNISSDFAIWLKRRLSTKAFECTPQKLLGSRFWR